MAKASDKSEASNTRLKAETDTDTHLEGTWPK
jgi:hypothetical protein